MERGAELALDLMTKTGRRREDYEFIFLSILIGFMATAADTRNRPTVLDFLKQ